MNNPIKVFISRAPALIPGMVEKVSKSEHPLILVPESFTLAAEQALVQNTPHKGLIGTSVFSPTSLVREIRERAGFPDKKVITGDGRHMILSLLLLKNKENLLFYRENTGQVSMAEKLASQIDDLVDGGFTAESLLTASSGMKDSTVFKCRDIALIWNEYQKILDAGYVDQSTAWSIAIGRLEESGLMQDMDLVVYGFDCINMELTDLIAAAYPLTRSITIGIVSETGCEDDHIFALTANSVKRFVRRIQKDPYKLPVTVEPYLASGADTDSGIRFLEQTVFSLKKQEGEIPDLSAVKVYYAANTTSECLHTAQALIEWHRQGIAWHDMAVAVCDDTTLPSMLPLVLASSGIPYSNRSGASMLLSEYAQFFLATLRSLRTGFKQEEVLKLIKSRFTNLGENEMMDLENYARSHGIDRNKWQKPFKGDDKEAERLENLRISLMNPLLELRKTLSAKGCTGRAAAQAIYEYMVSAGTYDLLLKREKELIERGMLSVADRNRQVWTAVNELLDQLAVFAGKDHLSLQELCLMLESSISAKMIKSLPQVADSVILSSPNMFFSSGIKAVALVGLQDVSAAPPSALLTPSECTRLVRAQTDGREDSGIGMTRREAAARAKQDIYQALACATDHLMVSCSAASSSGKVLTPSRVYSYITQLVKEQHPENVSGGLADDELVPFSPQFALERLAVMLRGTRTGKESFLTSQEPKDEAWRKALSFLYYNENWHGRMQGVLDALHVKLESPGIPPELASRLYQQSRLSVSAIETAGTCLYWAFLSYALRLHIRKDFVFEADSQGTFSHQILQRFFEEAVKMAGWPALDDVTVSRLLNRIFAEETKEWRDGPLGKNMSGRYRGGEIIRTVRTAVLSIMKAIQAQPHFTPIGMEVGFGESMSKSPLHFPDVTIRMDDGQEIHLSGIIDRVDTVTFDDGRSAVLVYDYKSSDKEVHVPALEEGLQIQLPIYLKAVKQGMPDHILAGALYQPVKQVLVDAEDDDFQAIADGIEKALRAKGIFLDDEQIQKASAPLKIPRKSSSGTSDVISVVTKDGMEEVILEGEESAKRVLARMLSGRTTPNPIQDGMRSPCEFCQVPDGCPRDPRLEGGKMRKLDHAKPFGKTDSDEEDDSYDDDFNGED